MTITFDVVGLREKVMIKIATAKGITPTELVENVTNSFLEGQVRGHYQALFNDLTPAELISLFGDIT